MVKSEKDKEQDKKVKDKERRRRGSRKYGQARKKHSKKGVYSCVVAGVILVLLLILLVFTYSSKGQAAALIGASGLGALILSWIGVTMGIRGLREREKDYITCKIGIGSNAFFLLVFIMIFIRGII